MVDLSPEQVAYLLAPPSRRELLEILATLHASLSSVALWLLEEDPEARDRLMLDLHGEIDKISALARGLANEGADPEWDYRA